MGPEQWWVFDRPLMRDRLFLCGLLLGVAFLIVEVLGTSGEASASYAFDIIASVPKALFSTGIVGGSIREYRRARRPAAEL